MKTENAKMNRIKVNITVPEELLTLVDDFAEKNYTNRSMLFVTAVKSYIDSNLALSYLGDISKSMKVISSKNELEPSDAEELNRIISMLEMLTMRK